MKNNKILYLLTILIALFSFNTNVNAAKELTCVYEWDPDNNERIVVVQKDDGKKYAYVTSEQVKKGDYGLDSLKYGAWKERYYKNFSPSGIWESCEGSYDQTIKASFMSADGISLEASYSSDLSPLTGTEMFVRKDQLVSIGKNEGYLDDDADADDIDYYFSTVATRVCVPPNDTNPQCYFLVGNEEYCDNCEVLYNNERFINFKDNYQLYAMRPYADNLYQLENNAQDFKTWLSKFFCSTNSGNKLCKMVFDYKYIRDDGSVAIDDNLARSCYFVHKYQKDIILGGLEELRFRFLFWGDDNFDVSYAPYGYITETNPGGVFTAFDFDTGDLTYYSDNIHLYPRNSNLQEFGVEYIKKYKDQGDCPEITFCADDASDGGNLNWYLELGNAEEIAATGKYTIGMCYNYNEETGEIEDVYVNDELTYNLLGGIITIEKCEDLFTGDEESEKLLENIKTLFTLSRISIPLIIIVLGSIDFVKCIFSGNEDGMKKAQNKFMKRLLLGVGIFLVPTLLKFVLEIANEIWPNISSDFCGIL